MRANETLNFSEFMTVCRKLGIFPKLLSQKQLWQVRARARKDRRAPFPTTFARGLTGSSVRVR